MSEDEKPKEIEKKIDNKNLQKSPHDVEKDQEAKLRAKYPGIKPGGSSFLQKRLSKGTKFFDSGDYNMAKAKMGSSAKPVPMAQKLIISNDGGGVTGDTIPTPDTVPQRKASLHTQSKLAAGIPS